MISNYSEFDPNTIDPIKYKSFVFFENLACQLDIKPGIKLQIGVGKGFTLKHMIARWGEDAVGIDLLNESQSEQVIITDVSKIDTTLPLSWVENDVASTGTDIGRQLRWAGFVWALKNLKPGGIMISSADHMISQPATAMAVSMGCEVTPLTVYDHCDWAQYLNQQTPWKTSGYILVKKL